MKRRLAAALALGAAAVAGFAPFGIFPLPCLSLACLCLLWRGSASAGEAAAQGFAWGLGFFLCGVSWVYVSLHDVGGMDAPLALLATLLFCAYLAAFPAAAGYAYRRLAGANPAAPLADALLLAAVWTLAEWARGTLFTGFPWLSLGYSQTPPSPLAGYAPLIGSYGIGFVLVLIAGLLISSRRRPAPAALALVIIIAGGLLRLPAWTAPTGTPVTVSLLQGNIPQSLKWDPALLQLSVTTYRQLAAEHPAQLIVTPETAIPLFFDQIPDELLKAYAGKGDLLLGGAMRDGRGDYFNTAIALAPTLAPQSYAKRHLVPFGEFVPPGFGWFFELVRIPMSDFSAGAERQPTLRLAGQAIAPDICYEDLFGEEIIRQLPEATLLINLSNTAWFGHSLAQPQHLQIARMRAMETGRPVLRATNTGMTAAISPDGTVAAELDPFTTGALTIAVSGYGGTTPFILAGNGGAMVLVVVGLLPTLRRVKHGLGKKSEA